ncbi:LEA type 2 family protein [Haladaptatus pallidirubidus]
MQNRKIPAWWVTHIRNDEQTTLRIQSEVRSSAVGRSVRVPYEDEIETDIIGQFNSTETRPVNASAPFVSDPVLYVNETGANWGSVTQERTPIQLRMRAYNPKSIPYTISEIGYEMTMNDVPVGNGTTAQPYTIPAKSEKTLRLQANIRNQQLDDWWVSHLENDQVTELQIEFHAKIDLPTGDTVRVPLRSMTYERQIETEIFQNDSAEGALDDVNPAPGSTTRKTTDGEPTDETETVEETTGTTPTSESGDGTTTVETDDETTTDDGGLLGTLLAVELFDGR